MIKTYLTFTIFFLNISYVSALVTCSPDDCDPGCCGSCTYEACEEVKSRFEDLVEIPHTFEEPSEACEFNDPTIDKLSQSVDGVEITKIPELNVEKKWKECKTKTKSNSSCCD